jgi:hypothetical protein
VREEVDGMEATRIAPGNLSFGDDVKAKRYQTLAGRRDFQPTIQIDT